MAPPELPRDVPVANVREPVHVHRFPALGQDADRAVAHRLQRRARRAAPSSRTTDRRDAARPPCRSDSSAAPSAGASPIFCSAPDARSISTIRSRASNRSSPLIAFGTRPSASFTSRTTPCSSITIGIGSEWRLPDLEVVRVVRGRDLHHAGAECRDPRTRRRSRGSRRSTIGSRTDLPHEVAISLVVRDSRPRPRRRASSRGASSRSRASGRVVRRPDTRCGRACPVSSWNSASSSLSEVRQRGHQWITRYPR